MGSCLASHKDRLSKLEHNLSVMKTSMQTTQSLSLETQGEYRRINAKVIQHECIIPKLNHEVEVSLQRVNTVISSVEKKMGELKDRMEEIKQSNMNAEIPLNVVSS